MENNLWFNQSGDLSGTQPSVIFQNNMIDGLSKFGNSFLINRRSVNNNTLKGLLSSRTDPRWQQLLKNKIAFIDMLLNTGGVRPSISKASSRMIPLGQTTAPQVPIRTVNSLSVPPVNDYSNVDAYCEKYSLAYLSGNGSEMNLIASTVASMYNISNEQAKSLLAERCLCNGYELPTDEPTDIPCGSLGDRESILCTSYQNALSSGSQVSMNMVVSQVASYLAISSQEASAYLKRCCYNNTGTGSNIPCKYVRAEGVCQKYWSYMNNNDAQSAMQEVNQFALNEGISTPAAYALVLKCCDDSGLEEFSCERVSQDWCTKFHAAFPFGKNSANMQGSVNPFIVYAGGFGYTLTYDQAYDILLRCCGEGNVSNKICNDPRWVNLPMGGTIGQANYNYGKNNYCDRCSAGTGSFPVSWNPNTGNWYYDQSNGTDYCSCCQPTNPNVDYSCENVPEEFCIQFRNATASGQTTALTNVVSTFTNYAANLGASLSYNEAYNILKRCCEQSTRPTEPTRPTLPPVPTKPTQTQIKNITNIATPTRGFDGEFMLGDY